MDVVVFPQMIVPLLVLDKRIIKGIETALEGSKMVLLLAAKKNVDHQDAIGTKDLYQVGTVASILRMIKIPDGGIKILVQGICKANALSFSTGKEISFRGFPCSVLKRYAKTWMQIRCTSVRNGPV